MDADIPSNYVAQLSGHKNLRSLDSYKTASRVHQRKMSNVLSRSTSHQKNNDSVSAVSQATSSSQCTVNNRVMNYHANSAVNAHKFLGCFLELPWLKSRDALSTSSTLRAIKITTTTQYQSKEEESS